MSTLTIPVGDTTINIAEGVGHEVRLPNGFSVSIQRSSFHYCGADTAETAVMGPDGCLIEWPLKGDDTVQGYQSATEIAATIRRASRM